MAPLLQIEDLHVTLASRRGTLRALRGLDLAVGHGETLGLVGESGCGKSMTARAILNILPPPLKLSRGRILLESASGGGPVDLAALDTESEAMRAVRGGEIAMIFQEPMTSLSPVHTIGEQIAEVLRLHKRLGRAAAKERAIEMLEIVGMPNARQRYGAYPFNLSGGMRQRAMIAMALCCRPRLLVADEPTTALDVTIQAQILDLLQQLQAELGMSVLLITHDLGVVARATRRVAVMYLGQIVEETTDGRALCHAAPSLYPRAAALHAAAGTQGARAAAADPRQCAAGAGGGAGMRLPSPLPRCRRRALRSGGAGAGGGGARP